MNPEIVVIRENASISVAGHTYSITSEIVERMLSKVVVDPETGCWTWLGNRNGGGYGKISIGSHMAPVHRVSFSAFVAHIPAGLVTDHLCRNRGCCNPEHLEVVTHTENVRRGDATGLKTHCRRGHELSAENVYANPSGKRQCRICLRANKAKSYARRKAGIAGAPKTHCRSGKHEWIEENISTESNGNRKCRLCRNASTRKSQDKHWKPSQLKQH